MPGKDAFSRFLNLLIEHQASILEMFHRLVDELKKYLPDLGEKSAADSKAFQSFGKPVKGEQKLAEDDRRRDTDDRGIKPVIDTRTLWKTKIHETLFPERFDVFSYDETGQVFCSCPSKKRGQDEMRSLAFVGFEKDRNTLKYRCPAAAFDFECAGRVECEKLSPVDVGDFGRIVRVPLEPDRPILTPFARHTEKWQKAYKRRTSVERVNSRIDQVLGFEQQTIRGKAKMETRVTLALVVLLAMALGRIRIGQADKMCSLVSPVRRAA